MKIRLGYVSNSSSEAFLCDTVLSLQDIKITLTSMLDFYNSISRENEPPLSFEQVFEEPRVFSVDDYRSLKGIEYPFLWVGPEKFTRPLIVSQDDNTIPSALFSLIEVAFNATREHLG